MTKLRMYTIESLEDVREGEETLFHGKPITFRFEGEGPVKVKYFGMDEFLPIEVNPRTSENCIFISAMRPAHDVSDIKIDRVKFIEILNTIGTYSFAKFILKLQ